MIDTVQHMAAGAYALRWVLVVAGFVLMGMWVAVVVDQRNTAEKRAARLATDLADERAWVDQLEAENAEARRDYIDRVHARVAARRTPEHRRSQIVAVPTYGEVRRG